MESIPSASDAWQGGDVGYYRDVDHVITNASPRPAPVALDRNNIRDNTMHNAKHNVKCHASARANTHLNAKSTGKSTIKGKTKTNAKDDTLFLQLLWVFPRIFETDQILTLMLVDCVPLVFQE